ncbi:hypothetical protein PRIPAC_74539 [Pristionchus pacificus]|uniref:Uncharacterized protein n=1 Tax=Pristionchus pacificus TaxID=54126 RepID=A0A2A6BZR1_PRIPA|nr:hypothetical protein PRIPAC_74539 [Pristionchus pacificus]|eukprot:PDM71263.1 hypothetical protein PRIPAC_37670 [Pristionchus pacificus]
MFAYIEVGIAILCFIILLPCVVVLFTTVLHINCKVILGTSALAQEVMLASQISMFGYDIYVGNVMPVSEDPDKPFLLVHEASYIYTTFLSLMIVLERYVATYNPASYETQTFNYPWVVTTAVIGLFLCSLASYSIHIYYMYTVMIPIMLLTEMLICVLSITLLFYCKRQLRNLPYDSRRLRAKYQLGEVYSFTQAVLPAILISSLLKLLALGPPTIWRAGIIDFPTNQVLFFPMHACTCVVMKCCLIFMHKGMMRTLRSVLPRFTHRISISISPVQPVVDKEKETDTYFGYMATAWQ